jgi:hypothetical protein
LLASNKCRIHSPRLLLTGRFGPRSCWRSRQFPGLWLDSGALFGRNAIQLLATLDQGLATQEHQDFIAKLARSRP